MFCTCQTQLPPWCGRGLSWCEWGSNPFAGIRAGNSTLHSTGWQPLGRFIPFWGVKRHVVFLFGFFSCTTGLFFKKTKLKSCFLQQVDVGKQKGTAETLQRNKSCSVVVWVCIMCHSWHSLDKIADRKHSSH